MTATRRLRFGTGVLKGYGEGMRELRWFEGSVVDYDTSILG